MTIVNNSTPSIHDFKLPNHGEIIRAVHNYLNARNTKFLLDLKPNEQAKINQIQNLEERAQQQKIKEQEIYSNLLKKIRNSGLINKSIVYTTISNNNTNETNIYNILKEINKIYDTLGLSEFGQFILQDNFKDNFNKLLDIELNGAVISSRGICKGLATLWAFSRIQQERGDLRNEEIDNMSKLKNIIDKLVSFKSQEDMLNKINWDVPEQIKMRETSFKSQENMSININSYAIDPDINQINSRVIDPDINQINSYAIDSNMNQIESSETSSKLPYNDIQTLISTLNLMQNALIDLGIDAKVIDDSDINSDGLIKSDLEKYGQRLSLFQFLEEDKNDKSKPKIYAPTEIYDYKSVFLYNEDAIEAKLKSIITPGLMISLSAGRPYVGGHATSVYMNKDHSMEFYDSNTGVVKLEKDQYKELAQEFMRAMRFFNYYIDLPVRGVLDVGFLGGYQYRGNMTFGIQICSLDKGEILQNQRKDFIDVQKEDIIKNVGLDKKDHVNELGDLQIEALSSADANIFALNKPDSYKYLVDKASELHKGQIEALVSEGALHLARKKPDSYNYLVDKASELELKKDQIEGLVSEDAIILIMKKPNSYKYLVDKASELDKG